MSQTSNDSSEPQEDIINLIDPLTLTSNSAHVEMTESTLSKLEKSLECPVCYKIPRNLPISCCEAGHIVCQLCRGRVTICPTCRGSLDSNMTNSLAANQIMLVDHKCKFAFYGCDVKMKLDEIVVHEKTCPERTIICPRSQCKEEVQLRKFTKHATKSKCSVPRDAQSKPILYELAPPGCEFNPNENQSFRIMSFQDHDRTFYLLSFYLATKKCFIFSVMLPDDVETASKYKVRFTVLHDRHQSHQRSLIFEGLVLSIEDLPNIENKEANVKYWFVAYDSMEPFFHRHNRLSFPIDMEVLCIGKKRKRF